MTERQPIAVGVVGCGVIGRRVADAVRRQPDMELTGVADAAADWRVAQAMSRGMALFAASAEAAMDMERAGLSVAGDPRTGAVGGAQRTPEVRRKSGEAAEPTALTVRRRSWPGSSRHPARSWRSVAICPRGRFA